MPLVGEHVTDTEQPSGRCGIWSLSDFSGTTSYRAAAIRRLRASGELIGQLLLAAVDELVQLFGDRIVHRWLLVLGQPLLPDSVCPLRRIRCAIFGPLLEARVVRNVAAIEGGLEVGEGMRRTEEVLAGPVLADRVDRLAVLRQIEPLDERRHHPALVLVHDELLAPDRQAALEPAGRVQHEVGAGENGWQQRRRALVRGLRVGDLRRRQRAARAERHTETAGQRGDGVQHDRRLGRTEGRRTGLHGHRRGERAEDHRRTGSYQLRERHAGQRLGQCLRGDTGRGGGGHGAGEDEGGDDARLVVAGVHLRGAQHRAVPYKRRRRIDQARDDGAVTEIATERDAGHVDRVLRTTCRCHRAHERLVAVLQVREDHVEVPLADRDVDGLAHRATTVVEVQRLVRQLDEVAEVLDRRVPTAVVDVERERRPVVGRKHSGVAADANTARRIPAVLDVFAWRRGLHDLPAHAPRETDSCSVDRCAGVGKNLQRRRVVANLHTDFLQDRLGVVLDDLETLVADDLERFHRPRQVCLGLDDVRSAQRLSPGAPSAASAGNGFAAVVGGRHVRYSCLRRRRPGAASADEVRSGRVTAPARFGVGAVACGNAIAETNSCWNCGSVAVSILMTARAEAFNSVRASIESSARTAPAPAALPTERTALTGASGTSPSTSAYSGSMWAPNAPARRMSPTLSTPACIISRSMPARSAALASWMARTSFCVMDNSTESDRNRT